MLIVPAIDLLDGKAVRLYQGSYDKVTQYDNDPLVAAERIVACGIRRLHLVDLDAARGKGAHNREVIQRIAQTFDVEIEVGGGIRTSDDLVALEDVGVDFFIVGTTLIRDPEAVGSWASGRPGRVFAGIDAFDGIVKISGWEQAASIPDTELAKKAAGLGCAAIIYTNIARDGTLSGPDLERTIGIAQASKVPVFVSGGVGTSDDLHRIASAGDRGIAGAIVGKALYEGRINLGELCRQYPQLGGIR